MKRNEERDEKIVNAVKMQDKTLEEIGEEYGISRERVRQIASAKSVKSHMNAKKNPFYQQAIEMKKQGMAEKDIAMQIGATYGTVRRWCRAERLSSVSTIKREKHEDEILNLRKQGLTQKKIAEKLDLGQSFISKCLIRLGNRTKIAREEAAVRDEKIKQDHTAGMTYKQLAAKYDTGEANIGRILHKENK